MAMTLCFLDDDDRATVQRLDAKYQRIMNRMDIVPPSSPLIGKFLKQVIGEPRERSSISISLPSPPRGISCISNPDKPF